MTRRNQRRSRNREQYKKTNNHLSKMLDLGRLNYFRYDAKEIFSIYKIDDKIWVPLLASLVSKATRLGIKEAKVYLFKKEEENILSEEAAKELSTLLDRYKKWR